MRSWRSPWGSLIALVLSFLYLLARRVITLKESSVSFVAGFKAMVPAILVLTLAVSLENLTGLPGVDLFVASMMEGVAPGPFNLLPVVIFLVAVFLAFSTGTRWDTFGILIPIVLPIFSNDLTLLTIGISACLAGTVAGDHCSPISDTAAMASACDNMNHVDHVSTQLPCVFTMAAVSFVMFVLAGFVQNAFICLPIGVVLTLAVLVVLKKTVGRVPDGARPKLWTRFQSRCKRKVATSDRQPGLREGRAALPESDSVVLVGLVGFRWHLPRACYDDRRCCSRMVERCGCGA